jgi:ubiquinone/menaquinone biosynthesis C-methylase UbiE
MNEETKNIIKVFDEHAELYVEKYMDVSIYQNVLDQFCSMLPEKDSNILDVACGPGNITRYLLDKRPDWSITGADIAPKMLDLARIHNPTAKFINLDCRAINALKEKYQGILCGFGLPYLPKEEAIKFIQDAYDKLLPGGLLYLCTMEDDYKNSEKVRSSTGKGPALFMHYHEAGYLYTAGEQAGFKIVLLDRLNLDKRAEAKPELILIMQK